MPKQTVTRPCILALLFAASCITSARSQGLPPPPGSHATDKPDTSAPGPATFDVASIKEHSSDDHNMRWMTKDDGETMVNVPLQSMIASAYNIKMYLISGGPSWVNSKGFDLDAKALPGEGADKVKLTEEQRRAMMRALLAERFHLKAHIESRLLPVFDLIVAKGGPKIQPLEAPAADSEDAKKRGSMYFEPGHLKAQWYKIASLAEELSYMIEHTVIDKTGMTGDYNIDLSWTPDSELAAAPDKTATGADPKPSIYASVQEQLGLKLVPNKGQVDTLVIDHAELPTAN